MAQFAEVDAWLAVLELRRGATVEELKKSYRELILVWHPDRFQVNETLRQRAETKTKQINAAYSSLLSHLCATPEPVQSRTWSSAQPSQGIKSRQTCRRCEGQGCWSCKQQGFVYASPSSKCPNCYPQLLVHYLPDGIICSYCMGVGFYNFELSPR